MAAATKSIPRHIAIIMDGNGRWAKAARLAADQRPRKRGGGSARMCRRLWRIESGIPDALRFLGRKLAATEERSLRPDAAARKVFEGKDAGADREKCSATGDRTADRFAGQLPEAIARIDRTHRGKQRADADSRAQLRRTRLEIIDGIKSLLRADRARPHRSGDDRSSRCSANIFTPGIIPTRICSSALPAKCGFPIFCSGSFPIPRCMSRQSSGRISQEKICLRRWTISRKDNVVTAGCDVLEGRASAQSRTRRISSLRRSRRARILGSARVSRAGFGVSPKQSFRKSAKAGRFRQHARRVRYPEELTTNLQQLFRDGINQQFSGTSEREAICLAGKESIADQSLCLILINYIGGDPIPGAQTEGDMFHPLHRGS